MKGTVYPRPAKRVPDRKGGERLAPLRPFEEWTDPRSGRTVRAGANGSSWCYQLTTGSKANGNRRHHSKGGFATKAECEAALTAVIAKLGQGDSRPLQKADATPVGAYLESWVAGRDGLKPSTKDGYERVIRAWISPRDGNGIYRPLPYLGGVPLRDLGPDHLSGLFAKLRSSGARGGRPLGTRSVQLTARVLGMALADAAESGKLPANPLELIPRRQRPKHRPEKQDDRFWSPAEARAFLGATAGRRMHPLYALALDSGARRGELAGLRWQDVDRRAGAVTIRSNRVMVGTEVVEGDTKSSKARRVDLDPRTIDALAAWQATQQADREAAGSVWLGGMPGRTGYVFTDELGAPYRPDWLSADFERAQANVDVDRLVFHGLRHTSATILLAAGVPVHVVSERLGHANVRITLDTYAHVIPTQHTDAARVLGAALYDGDEGQGEGAA